MVKIEFATAYQSFEQSLLTIKSIFTDYGKSIHKARNELKIIQLNDIDCVVKAFRVPNFVNQFVYAYIRNSKAYKSYHNALKLCSLGVNTPEPIGYIEFHDKGLLKESFFISKHYPYELTMANVRDDKLDDKIAILEAFTAFTYDLHQKGVWHVDYSGGNILINRKQAGYEFSLVDINRMQFRSVTGYEGLENFNKMWFDEESLHIIAKKYASLSNLNDEQALKEILAHDQKLKEHVLRRRKIKAFFKGDR